MRCVRKRSTGFMTQTYPLVSQGFATCRVIPFINILHRTGQDPGFVGLGSHLAQLSGPGNIETAPLRNYYDAVGVLSQTGKTRPRGCPRNQIFGEVIPNGMYTENT